MRQSKIVFTLTGGLILAVATISCSAKNSTRTADNPSSRDTMTASQRAASPEPVPSDRTGAGTSPYDSNRVTACADQKGDAVGSPDCVPQNRPTASSDRSEWGSPVQGVSGCASRRDARGNVVYDDPSCPTRYRQVHRTMGSSDQNVSVTRESAFFDRYIGKSVKHAREAEIAGEHSHAIEMTQHANLALAEAKQAQRAGNVPGLEEGIFELTEAMTIGLSSTRAQASDRAASDRTDSTVTGTDRVATDASTRCSSRTDANGTISYDDPACRTQDEQSGNTVQDATAHIREARIRLSEAAGMRPIDTATPRVMANPNTIPNTTVGAR